MSRFRASPLLFLCTRSDAHWLSGASQLSGRHCCGPLWMLSTCATTVSSGFWTCSPKDAAGTVRRCSRVRVAPAPGVVVDRCLLTTSRLKNSEPTCEIHLRFAYCTSPHTHAAARRVPSGGRRPFMAGAFHSPCPSAPAHRAKPPCFAGSS